MSFPDLPITPVLPELLSSLERAPNAVLVAPPGAGKTTLVPLALLDAPWRNSGRIIMLEPRRMAARMAAQRMADLLGEPVGKRVGYRVRFDTRVGAETAIEVVTEGVFTRMLARDPGLLDVAAVLFDEFHERSLDGDLALALCLDLQEGLREDLRLVAMSATLDGAAVAGMMQAPVIESAGRSFPVEISYRERQSAQPVEQAVARAVAQEMESGSSGDVLAFLPGQGEIERTFKLLEERLPANVDLHRLYGAVSVAAQDAALQPAPAGRRKIVLASAIAETSLTIEGVTTVIDSGLARQPVFEPATGLVRLETVRASQASVTQRAGRAGRLAPGRAIRLWREEQTRALPPFTPPEIVNADLTALLLDLTDWGVSDATRLKWLDQPPPAAMAEAREVLRRLGAITSSGTLTDHGKAMRRLSLPPRLSHMVLRAAAVSPASARRAALLAFLVQERGLAGRSLDLAQRCDHLESPQGRLDRRAQAIVSMADRLAAEAGKAQAAGRSGDSEILPHGVIAGFGFPDRIAANGGTLADGQARFRLANGRGAQMEETERMAREDFIVVLDMAGRAGAARILSAIALEKAQIEHHFADQIETISEGKFDSATGKLQAFRTRKLGALTLGKPQSVRVDDDVALDALLSAVRSSGLDILPWREADHLLRGRLALLNQHLGAPWPEVSDAVLLDNLHLWLAPFLQGQTSLSPLGKGALSDGMMLLAAAATRREIDALLPTHFAAPSGSSVPLDYSGERALLRIRPQELFGLDKHPAMLNGLLPLEIELLSPAGRAIQITRDLPGFWRGTWADVRSDMRGRYPKHPWPEDALSAEPTRRAKPRK